MATTGYQTTTTDGYETNWSVEQGERFLSMTDDQLRAEGISIIDCIDSEHGFIEVRRVPSSVKFCEG